MVCERYAGLKLSAEELIYVDPCPDLLVGAESVEMKPTSETKSKTTEIDNDGIIYSVAFFPNGNDIVCGGREGKVRHWRGKAGQEVGTAMYTGGYVLDIGVSSDGRWLVSGTDTGLVTVWDAKTHEKVTEIKGNAGRVFAVDVSPDGARIATGTENLSACVWSLESGERVFDPLKHQSWVVAVKYSPRGDRLATATWNRVSVRIYDSQDGRLLVDVPIRVKSHVNQSLVWSSDGRQLYALSREGRVHCLDASTGNSQFQWSIPGSEGPGCISLARSGAFIAASANSSISFWDTSTHEQIGSVIEHTDVPWSINISPDNILASGGYSGKIILQSLEEIIPQSYLVCPFSAHKLGR